MVTHDQADNLSLFAYHTLRHRRFSSSPSIQKIKMPVHQQFNVKSNETALFVSLQTAGHEQTHINVIQRYSVLFTSRQLTIDGLNIC